VSARDARSAEKTLAEWLAHPMEFGVKPTSTKYLTSISTAVAGMPAPVTVHVVEYQMPDGTYGKGFVNPITWSFLGDLPYDKLTNEQLVTAYSGWVWLFSALQNGNAQTDFAPSTTGSFTRKLKQDGIDGVTITSQYRVGDSEFFEFEGRKAGSKVKGAGSVEATLVFDETEPQAALPIVYTFLAMVMRGEL
jgi:hypothetical protein